MITSLQQFIRFCLVGGSGLLLNIALTHLGVTVFGWWYFWAYLIATLLSWSFMFWANTFFTFPSDTRTTHSRRYALFISGYGVILGVNAGLVYAFTSYGEVHYVWSIIIATAITTLLTFTFSKYVIYKS